MLTRFSWLLARLALVALLLPPVAAVVACSADAGHAEGQGEEPAVAAQAEGLSTISCAKSSAAGYVQGKETPIEIVTVDGKHVQIDTADAYYVMAQAAARAGVTLSVVSGFRTMAEQQYLYSCYVHCNCNSCNLAARPGYSNHQSGHALDLNTSSPGVYAWLTAHGAAFGWKRTVPSEIWHWEWWGGGPGGGPCAPKPTADAGPKPTPSDAGHKPHEAGVPDPTPAPQTEPDAGAPIADEPDPNSAGASTEAASPPAPSEPQGGCSIASAPRSGAGLWRAILIGAALIVGVRRRGRRAREVDR